jgi:alkyldihydroxyacetonephosphate synthase
MKAWNGWGDESVHFDLPPRAHDLLRQLIGEGTARQDYPLERLLTPFPATRLSPHPLISTDQKERLDHSHGQSLPDWIALRGGTLQRFPDGVAFPDTFEGVQELLKFAEQHQIIVIPYGGGTSVVGHLQVPEGDRPVLSLSLERLNHLLDLDRYSMLATFEAGVRGPELEAHLRAKGTTLGHFPQSFEYSSLGGWVVTRSSGQESMHYGRIEGLFAGGEVLTPIGALHLPPFPASAAGPDLRHIVLGSEGRLGILTRVIVRISPLPERNEIYGIFFPSWDQAVEAVRELACGRVPLSMIRLSNPKETETSLALAGHEGQVSLLKQYLRLRRISINGACLCLVGLIGSPHVVEGARREAFSIVRRHKGISVGRAFGEAWKKYRFRAPYLRNTLWDLGYAVDTLETAVTWDKVAAIVEAIEKAISEGLTACNEGVHVFSHLSHVYPTGSSIYTTFVFRLAETPEETLSRWRALKEEASRAIVEAGGTISHHHGVGIDHKTYMEKEKGPVGMNALKQLFSHVDPGERMNPTKLLP